MRSNVVIFISILSWNASHETENCVKSVLSFLDSNTFNVYIHVLDNGSSQEDFDKLRTSLFALPITLHRSEINLGFTGGHNVLIQHALDADADYIWLLNNDAAPTPTALAAMLAVANSNAKCGAVSPVIRDRANPELFDFCGATHNWAALGSHRFETIEQAKVAQVAGESFWVAGTAVLYSVAAIRQVGMLDDSLFAYFDDNEMSERLHAHGWSSLMAWDADVLHATTHMATERRPAYFHYLMARNAVMFWRRYTPAGHRRWLNLRLIDRMLFYSNRLLDKGSWVNADATLRGLSDALWGVSGPPRHHVPPPWFFRVIRRLLRRNHSKHYG